MSEMVCSEIVETITAYLEGALPADDRARFEAHVSACAFCTEYLAQMRETIARVGTLEEPSLSPQARERLIAAFREWCA